MDNNLNDRDLDSESATKENTADDNQDTFAQKFETLMNQFVTDLKELGVNTCIVSAIFDNRPICTHTGTDYSAAKLGIHTARLLKQKILEDLDL